MKDILINQETFKYNIYLSEYMDSYTSFYKISKKYRKKYFLFGKLIEVETLKFCFEIRCDIENPIHDKNILKEIIYEAYNKYIHAMIRQQEIERGEII